MVRFAYQDIANSYHEVKQAACGRQACSVMIMVANEVDAMASCKMLTQLLRSDNIAYTIRPVLNFDEVVHTYQSFMTDDIKSIFMLNCGALYNIPKTFDLERGGDVRVFILDNHRPLHLANIYSKHSVVVFDDNYDANEEDSESLPSDGSELSGGISSSDSDSSSEGDAEDDDDMFNEELEAADIDAAFRNPAEGNEDAELEDDDNNNNSDGDNDAEEAEEAAEGEEEVEEGSDEEGEELGSDEIRSEDSESEEEGSQAGSAADDEGEGDADVTVEYNDLGEVLPKKQKGTGKRKQAKAPRGSPSSKSHKRSRVGAAEGTTEGTGSTRTGGDTALDESLLSEWDAAGTQERRRTRDLYSADDAADADADADADAEEAERAEESDDQEENMQIRGRKRRTAEAEEALRAKERRRGLNSYYASPGIKTAPTSLMLTGLMADQLGSRQMPTEVVWQAVLGVTSQYLSGHLHEGLYTEYCHFLKTQFGDALRTSTERNTYSVRASEEPVVPAVAAGSADVVRGEESELMLVPGSENGHVEEAAEYRFFLYRHWSLYDAMFHSPYVASKLSVWNHQGTAKLQELLARMGVPLQQCKQAYQYMTPVLRNHFAQQMADQNILDTYNFTNPGVTFKSFYRYNAFKNPIAASDIVHAATALTEMYGAAAYSASSLSAPASAGINANGAGNAGGDEHTDHADGSGAASSAVVVSAGAAAGAGKISSIDAFYDAYYCLGMKSDELMQKGIQAALDLQRTIVKKASAMLDGNSSIHRSNRLYYACINRTNTSSWGPGASSSAAGGSGAAGTGRGGFADAGSSSSGSAAAASAGSGGGGGAEIEHSFGRPMVLAKLGQYIMDIKRNIPKKNGGWTGSALLPLILLSEKQDSTFLVVGISPLSSLSGGEALTEEQERKLAPLTNFRQFFKLAGQLLGAPVRHISFDANVVEVRREDVQEFLGALDDSLRKATPRYNSTTV